MHRQGALATLTNVRQLDCPGPTATLSRGLLVTAAVRQAAAQNTAMTLERWLEALAAGHSVPAAMAPDDAHRLAPLTLDSLDWFNLLVCDGSTLWQLHHGPAGRQLWRLPPGIHGLSNGHPDIHWPKQRRLVQHLAALQPNLTDTPSLSDSAYMEALQDDWRPPSDQLPATGLDLTREALLSSPFITSPEYGTRASSLVRWSREGAITLTERRFSPEGHCIATRVARASGGHRWQLR